MCNVIPIIQKGKNTCGQTCVAMLSGKTEIDICSIIGHCRGTHTREIIKALKTLNIKSDSKLLRLCNKRTLPSIAILKAIPRDRKAAGRWHWILKHKDKLYDPSGYTIKYREGSSFWAGLRITSFLEIYTHA